MDIKKITSYFKYVNINYPKLKPAQAAYYEKSPEVLTHQKEEYKSNKLKQY